jgi:hypothetical protein
MESILRTILALSLVLIVYGVITVGTCTIAYLIEQDRLIWDNWSRVMESGGVAFVLGMLLLTVWLNKRP